MNITLCGLGGRRHCGLTLIDLLVTIVLLLLVSATLLHAETRAQKIANRQMCERNLILIGQAMDMYAKLEPSMLPFPRTRYDIATAGKPTAFTGSKAMNPFKEDGPEMNDVSAALFLLLRTQKITATTFVCPSSEAKAWDFGGPAKKASDVSNWPSAKYLSYSYRNPYPNIDAVDTGYKNIEAAVDARTALVADGNPGGDAVLQLTATSSQNALRKANSLNHEGYGQNVLYGDFHVEWSETPFCGQNQDNIYTYGPSKEGRGGLGVIGSPTDPGDSVLLPVINSGQAKP